MFMGWAPRLRTLEHAPVASTSACRMVDLARAKAARPAASTVPSLVVGRRALEAVCQRKPAVRGGRKVRNQKRLVGERLHREALQRQGQDPRPRTHKGGANYKGRGVAADVDTQRRWGGWAERAVERLAR
jgi:hypothetical protein